MDVPKSVESPALAALKASRTACQMTRKTFFSCWTRGLGFSKPPPTQDVPSNTSLTPTASVCHIAKLIICDRFETAALTRMTTDGHQKRTLHTLGLRRTPYGNLYSVYV